MKKSLIYALAIAAIAGMTSCSQEIDSPAASADGGKLVTVDVQIPLNDGIARAVPQIPEGYKLRCIMQLLDPQGNPLADSRMVEEVEAGAENVRFSFIAPADGYQGAMFWADYVQTLDTDYLYNTDDLKAITYVGANAAGAFDNPAADAFYGYLLSGNSSLTLQRPFTRITFKCADNSYAAYTTVKVTSMAAPTAFNVVNGNTGAFDTSLASGELTVGDNGEWFSTYLFVGNNSGATLGEDNDIKLTLTGAEPALDLTVEGENVPLTRNLRHHGPDQLDRRRSHRHRREFPRWHGQPRRARRDCSGQLRQRRRHLFGHLRQRQVRGRGICHRRHQGLCGSPDKHGPRKTFRRRQHTHRHSRIR